MKLRDIGEAVGFHVSYDGSTNSVYIGERPAAVQNTGTGYLTNGQPVTEENVLALLRQIERDWPTGTIWGTNNQGNNNVPYRIIFIAHFKNNVSRPDLGQVIQPTAGVGGIPEDKSPLETGCLRAAGCHYGRRYAPDFGPRR